MPLRGSLLRRLKKLNQKRQKAEARKFKQNVKKEAALLKMLRLGRIKEEGRSLLRKQIAREKSRIRIAKGPSRIGAIESFLGRQAKRAVTVAAKEARKELNPRKKRRKRRKR